MAQDNSFKTGLRFVDLGLAAGLAWLPPVSCQHLKQRDEKEAKEAIKHGADVIMFDNVILNQNDILAFLRITAAKPERLLIFFKAAAEPAEPQPPWNLLTPRTQP
ncbi:hypothetical protein PtA15_11A351 [Puccinia triticina]|uniref:Uncharacterized protein n=1 Tax=Puccinia triticina TaxID=208348 RepID=A0ABY7CWK8_9BASI|nr:uncharacterized protein PtA15_11A351 [Puccinia triticina]WAQ89661.1 hypothetical protein PtA15_11A351 [Puccinia triticina]